MNPGKCIIFVVMIVFFSLSLTFPQDIGVTAVRDADKILPEQQRAQVKNEILEWRLENIIPDLMRREGIDMWVIICREYNEDPVYLSMVP